MKSSPSFESSPGDQPSISPDYRQILGAVADAVIAVDCQSRIVYLNDAVEHLLGWPGNQLVGQPLELIQPPRFREAHRAAFYHYMETGIERIIGHAIRVPALCHDGSELEIELVVAPAIESNGDKIVVASLRDLRERRELEQELESRTEFDKAMERLRAIHAITDTALTHLGLDDMLQELLMRLRDILRVDVATVLLAEDEGQILLARASVGLEEETRYQIPVPIGRGLSGRVAQSGLPLIVDDISRVEVVSPFIRERVRSWMGAPLQVENRSIGVIHVDSFSSRRFTPDELRLLQLVADRAASTIERARLYEAEQALRAESEISRERLAFLAEASRILGSSLDYEETFTTLSRVAVPALADWCAIYVVDLDGTVRTVTTAHVDPTKVALARELQERFPYDPDDQVGVPRVLRTGQAELVHELPDTLLAATITDPELLQIIRDLGLRSSMIVPLVARDRILGAITLISAESGRLFTESDLAMAEDLSRRAAMAVDNARLYEEAQDAIRVRDDLLSSVSHDLKNPLTALRGHAQLLQRRLKRTPLADDERLNAGIENIISTATKMNRLINDLVDLARLRMGRLLDLNRAPVDLLELIKEVVREHRRVAPRHTIEIAAGDETVIGNWDSSRLERVLDNLISNALKYSPMGGTVTISLARDPEAEDSIAIVTVTDQGIGIPAEDLPHIFDRFYRATNVGGIEGTGIGLAAARQIVEQHGGTLSVESSLDSGTTFTICLPDNIPSSQ